MTSGVIASSASTPRAGADADQDDGRDGASPSPDRPRRNRRRVASIVIGVGGVIALVALAVVQQRTAADRDDYAQRNAEARVELLGQSVGVRHQAGVARARIDAVTGALDRTAARLAATRDDLSTVTAKRNDVLALLRGTSDELRSTAEVLGSTQTELDLRTLRLTDTQQCLHGIQDALEQAAVDDFDGAVSALEGVRRPCDVALDRNQEALGGPAFDGSFADPFVLHDGDRYVAYATNSVGGSIQMLTGPDLGSLKLRGPALPSLPNWAKAGSTWAPTVLRRGDRWVLYYAVAQRTGGSCVAVATASSPTGPFTSEPLGVTCRRDLGGSIDPSPIVGRDGRAWLVWKVEGVPGRHPAQIVSQQLTPDGLHVRGRTVTLVHADQRWEHGVVEGPALVERGNRWLLLYSGGDWRTAGYGIGAAACEGPLGPCRKLRDGPIYSPAAPLTGAGGQEVFTGPDGTTWLAYHAWVRGQVGYPNPRRLYVARIDLDRPVPEITPVPITSR